MLVPIEKEAGRGRLAYQHSEPHQGFFEWEASRTRPKPGSLGFTSSGGSGGVSQATSANFYHLNSQSRKSPRVSRRISWKIPSEDRQNQGLLNSTDNNRLVARLLTIMSQRRPSDLLEERKIRNSTVESDPDVSDEEPSAPFMRVRRRICSKSYNPEEDLQADIRMIPKSEETKNKLKIMIKENLLFRELEPEQLSTLIDAMTEHEVSAGQVLIKAGNDAQGFYIIDSGEFEISQDQCKSWKRAEEETLGELSLIHSQPSEYTVRSVTDGKVYILDRNNYRKIVTKTNYEIRKKLEELINQVPELRDLPELDKIKVTDVLELMNFSDGDIIVKEGENPNGMYMVVCGAVRLPERIAQDGDYFGELPNSKPPKCDPSRTMSAVACGPTKVAYLDTQVYERLMGPCLAVLKRNSTGKAGKTPESA